MHVIKWVSPDALKPNPRNARTHSKKQIRQIADSIVAYGFTVPLLADESLMILAGHGRLVAAKLVGLSEVPVIVLKGLSEDKKRALLLADNKIAENAGWDRERLAIELPELAELLINEDLDISITGFEPVEETSYEIGYCKPPKHTQFKPGQSGNPRGRPKAIKSAGAALNNALEAKVKLRGNGKERGVSSLDAYFIRVVMDAIQGKASAQRLLLALMERFLPTIADAAPAENGRDARAELLKKIELMAQRRQGMPPDEK